MAGVDRLVWPLRIIAAALCILVGCVSLIVIGYVLHALIPILVLLASTGP